MSDPTPLTDAELADLPDPSLWMDAEDLLSIALRLLATVDAERARADQAEAERDALRGIVRRWEDGWEPEAAHPDDLGRWTRVTYSHLDDHCGYEHEEMTEAEVTAFRALDAGPTEGNPE